MARTVPTWGWVSLAIAAVAVWATDDRSARARRAWSGVPRLAQLALVGAVGGFVLGFVVPPSELGVAL